MAENSEVIVLSDRNFLSQQYLWFTIGQQKFIPGAHPKDDENVFIPLSIVGVDVYEVRGTLYRPGHVSLSVDCKPRTLFPLITKSKHKKRRRRKDLTVNIDVLSGDDRDSMVIPGIHHSINQTPLAGAWLEL